MSYRVKLLVVFIAVALITNGISLGVMYWLSSHYLYEGYRAKMLSITASTAVMLDGDELKRIQSRTDEGTPAWTQLRATLKRVRDANRRPDTYMKRVFTVVKTKDNPNALTVAVDSDENPATMAHAG